ncbi:MAG: dephospho-CoA kinase [Gammaproteobacteria bacterium]|nr:MAG: dephospho-CoA kinase [Gammaproteobacteria bacterium]
MIKIGLTGGIATGKTFISHILEQDYNLPIIDADKIVGDLYQKDKAGYLEIIKLFGYEILDKNQEIDRTKLAKIIFSDPLQKTKLESIIHPLVWQETNSKLNKLEKDGAKIVIIVVPLLQETSGQHRFDKIIVIQADRQTQIKRLYERNNFNEEKSLRIINSQSTFAQKQKIADYVIYNNLQTATEIKKQIDDILQDL